MDASAPPSRAALAAALLVAMARAAFLPAAAWWRDWILVLCAFWIAGHLAWNRRSWSFLALSVMGWLSGIYLLRLGGAMIGVLGVLP